MISQPAFTISVQGVVLGDAASRLDLLRRMEQLGADSFLLGDHPGGGPSPFVVLGAAAMLSERLRLGAYVANVGLRDPVQLAVDVATLDRLSGGRALLGLGAGHTPGEWTASGLPFPPARQRLERLVEAVEVVRRLLAGEVVRFEGAHLRLDDAVLLEPLPVQDPVPLLIGGNGRGVLRLAGCHADIVGLTGLGRTLADGHHHEVEWSPEQVDATVELVRRAASDAARERPPELEALVQHVELSDDRDRTAVEVAARVPGLRPEDVLTAPYVLVGTAAEIADHIVTVRRRWGITRFVVRPPALDAIEMVLAQAEPTESAQPDGPVLTQRPAGVVGNLPCMTVRVDEDP